MAFLPVKPKMGGKKGHGLHLMSDMTGIDGVNKTLKTNKPHSKRMGGAGMIYKNPGTKHDGSNAHVNAKAPGRKSHSSRKQA